MEIFYCLLLGGAVGLVSSFLGIGGGILIVPLLPSIAGIATKEAVATSLLIICFVSAKNIYGFNKKGLVPWASGISIGAGAAIATFIASLLIDYVEEKYLVFLLAFVILGVGVRLVTKRKQSSMATKSNRRFNAKAFVAGLFCGVLVGFTGIGGGVLYGPILLSLQLVKDEEMSPGSNLAMFMASVFGVVGFLSKVDTFSFPKLGLVHLDLALVVFSSAFVFSKIGHKYQGDISPDKRKLLLGGILILVFIKTIYRALHI